MAAQARPAKPLGSELKEDFRKRCLRDDAAVQVSWNAGRYRHKDPIEPHEQPWERGRVREASVSERCEPNQLGESRPACGIDHDEYVVEFPADAADEREWRHLGSE